MEKTIKFFDFCSGIGGGRIGLERNGFQCVGHSEIDPNTAETYKRFFNDERNFGDLTKIKIESMPDFDMLIAGFPCQSFSIVGKREGFKNSRGQIIYFLIEIMKKKNIKYFILENVKGLVNHDKGNTLRTIKKDNETFKRYLSNKYNIEENYRIEDILKWENSVIDYRQSDLRRYEGFFPTLRTGRHGLLYIKNGKIKRLNGYEALLIQGFPKEIASIVKKDNFFVNNKVLSQAGNAMTVNVIEKIGENILKSIKNKKKVYNGKLFD